MPELPASSLYVGSSVTILGRQLSIVDYADEFTRRTIESASQR